MLRARRPSFVETQGSQQEPVQWYTLAPRFRARMLLELFEAAATQALNVSGAVLIPDQWMVSFDPTDAKIRL
jgi:hypothetical protein